MGQEIQSTHFTKADFEQFYRNLRTETELLKKWFDEGILASNGQSAGFELETWLVDSSFRPAAVNVSFLERLNNPLVVSELSQFNVEINSSPHRLKGHCLSSFQKELQKTWDTCHACAVELDSDIMMIGILPTLKENMLTLDQMSPMQRYRALNEQVFRLRHGHSMALNISGKDHFERSLGNVMFESAATSLQIHLQIDPKRAARLYNASLILSAPMVALAANSPYLFGKDLWDETRIPLFEQAVAVGSSAAEQTKKLRRVTFGSGYVKKSLYECFSENLKSYPVLLPSIIQQDPALMHHLRLHNGTIWRWNRPLIGIGANGRVHLRVEHRVAAAGPTPVDVVANIAFYIGLVQQLATQETAPESQLAFTESRNNFYRAARDGLNASLLWLDRKKVPVHTLLFEKLIPEAEQGLAKQGIAKADIEFYLQEVIRERVRTQQNGAQWQRKFIAKHKRDFQGLAVAYKEREQQGNPVHTWNI